MYRAQSACSSTRSDVRDESSAIAARKPNTRKMRTSLSLDERVPRNYLLPYRKAHSNQGESMKLSTRASALVLAAALGTAGFVLPCVAPAGAALKPSVACAKVTSQPLSKTGGKIKATFASCTPTALAAGGSSLTSVQPNQTSGTLTEKVTWKNGKGTTTMIIKYAGTTI